VRSPAKTSILPEYLGSDSCRKFLSLSSGSFSAAA
jgi:hypothetical protein